MITVGITECFGSWQRHFLISSDQLSSDLKLKRPTPFSRRLMLSAREEDFWGHEGNGQIMGFQHLGI